jgi:hypothetical protein
MEGILYNNEIIESQVKIGVICVVVKRKTMVLLRNTTSLIGFALAS